MATSYSFIQPKTKSILKKLTKVWILFMVLAVLCIAGFYVLLNFQIYQKQNELTLIETHTHKLDLGIIAAKDYLNRLQFEQSKTTRIVENLDSQVIPSNKRYREGFERLLALIPAQITLRSLKIDNDYLELRGITPSKEVYVFLLQAPLKANFDESRVDFFPLANGWFNFVSVSRKTQPFILPQEEYDE
ncbi:hypothetical protein [Helicobacter himalayensis]|uniref:hypothetical protein n=1 Tax=Helicobacter himalayensis TaxID=1591088 RepID=UPI00082A95E9|nr:hypothetical protein [Helicobacter himalayensis]